MYSLHKVFSGWSLPKLHQVSDHVCDIHGENFKEQGEERAQFGNLRFWHAPRQFAARMRVSNTMSEAMKLQTCCYHLHGRQLMPEFKYVGILFTGFGQNGVQDENPIPHPWS